MNPKMGSQKKNTGASRKRSGNQGYITESGGAQNNFERQANTSGYSNSNMNQIQLQPIDKGNLSSKGAIAVSEKPPLLNKQRSDTFPPSKGINDAAVKEIRAKNKLLED